MFTTTSVFSTVCRHSIPRKQDHVKVPIKKPASLTGCDPCAILPLASWLREVLVNLTGIFLQTAYRLRRHLWAGWPLSNLAGLLLIGGGLAVAISWWPRFWLAALFGALLIAFSMFLRWAARRAYIHFEILPDSAALLQIEDPPPLRTEELVPVRASGWFSVEGKSQYYMDIEADFETMETREHIVLGRVHPSRFLLLGRWPAWELGWWYIFVQPTMIREISLGHLHFGRQTHLALRLVYATGEDTLQTIYLASEDHVVLRRVWDDLMLDAPRTLVPHRQEGSYQGERDTRPTGKSTRAKPVG